MRASFYEGAGRFRTGTAPEPTAGAGEAVLKVKRVGICGTDLHIFQGHLDQRVPKGGIIGHETFAEIAEAPGGSGLAVGDGGGVEPLPIATHDVTRAKVGQGDAVLVFGGGPIGALIALVSRHRGARVIVSEVNPFRIELLKGLGLEIVGPGVDVVEFATDWTGGEGVDVAFEVTGNP